MTSSFAPAQLDAHDPRTFRRVLGHYPSGVVGITSADTRGAPVGLVATSFTSVSLDPPLVAFYPQKTSTTWPVIRDRGAFCVNVLGAGQQDVCRKLAAKGGDKFVDVEWAAGPLGLPALHGAVARLACTLEAVHDAGDHEIAIGRVRHLDVNDSVAPLLFFQGGYGRFASSLIAAPSEADIIEHLRLASALGPHLDRASRELGVEVFVTGIAGDELVVIATSGHPDPARLPTQVGQRMPYIPPVGGAMAAFDDPRAWLDRGNVDEQTRRVLSAGLRLTRERGWAVTLTTAGTGEFQQAMAATSPLRPSPEQLEALRQAVDKLGADHTPADIVPGRDYPLRSVTVPVPEGGDRARLALTAFGLPPTSRREDLDRYVGRLRHVAGQVEPPSFVLGRT